MKVHQSGVEFSHREETPTQRDSYGFGPTMADCPHTPPRSSHGGSSYCPRPYHEPSPERRCLYSMPSQSPKVIHKWREDAGDTKCDSQQRGSVTAAGSDHHVAVLLQDDVGAVVKVEHRDAMELGGGAAGLGHRLRVDEVDLGGVRVGGTMGSKFRNGNNIHADLKWIPLQDTLQDSVLIIVVFESQEKRYWCLLMSLPLPGRILVRTSKPIKTRQLHNLSLLLCLLFVLNCYSEKVIQM